MSLIQSYIGYAAGQFKETLLTIHNLTKRRFSAGELYTTIFVGWTEKHLGLFDVNR